MGPLDQARQHLDKAKEFLDAAELDLSAGLLNAATSSAVTSGVTSKDAMCLALTGRTTKSDDHRGAVKELEQAGAAGHAVAPTLGRLLVLRTPAQYQASGVTKARAENAVKWAQRMYDAADGVVKR